MQCDMLPGMRAALTKTRRWRQIADNNAELRQQQNLYEAVRSDRNLYSKNLIAAQDEILDLKRKFKILVRAFLSPAMHRANLPMASLSNTNGPSPVS